MDQMKVVVIGGVAIGPKAASRIKRLNPDAKVTIVEKSDWLSYGGCGLPYFVGAMVKDVKDLMSTSWEAVRTPEYFKLAKDIDVLLGWEAVKIDRENKKVVITNVKTQETQELEYDKLVLATGADNFVPPIPGRDADGVFQLKTPQDALGMKDYVLKNDVSNAIIIGAGLIGMETCEALATWGPNVTIVEMMNKVFPSLLDNEMAVLFEDYLKSEDIDVYTSTKVEEIVKDEEGKVKGVKTDKGFIEGQMVLISTGVRPNTKLAEEAGLEVERGIIVNEYLQTSDPDIYAGGDCIVNKHIITGQNVYAPLGSTANKHGRIIGTNICGGKETFPGVLSTAICKVFDWNVGRTGLSEDQAKDLGYDVVSTVVAGPDKAHFFSGRKPLMSKIIADRKTGKLLGGQIVGPGDIARRLDVLVTAMSYGGTLDDLANFDLPYAPPFSGAMDHIINAANALKNIIDGNAIGIGYEEFKAKMNDENVVKIDLRTEVEVKRNPIPVEGLLHIPYEEIRERLDEIPKDKEVILMCMAGTRAYEVQLYLSKKGYDNVKFLKAGAEIWPLK